MKKGLIRKISLMYCPICHKVKAITREKISFKNYAENEARRLVTDLFLFFKKVEHEVKASGLQLNFAIFQ